jgi:hypothetical protein
MTRPILAALAALLLAGCGAEVTSTKVAATPTPKPPTPAKPCAMTPASPTPSRATPSAELLGALAVLRRPRTAADTVPAAALRHEPYLGGPMLESARRVQLPGGGEQWIVPVENLTPPLEIPQACLRAMPPDQRRATRDAIRDSRNRAPLEGVAIVKRDALARHWPLPAIREGRALAFETCTGPLHNRVTLAGIVPDGVTQVTVTAKDGAIVQTMPDQNVVELEQDRPDGPSGLPAHITSTTAGSPLEYALEPLTTKHLDEPCEPPSRKSIGQRRTPATKLRSPKGARIELQTSRWQPEDTGPQVAGATYREGGRRCLRVASERRLRAGQDAHEFCVDDATLRAERFVVNLTRLPSGDVLLEGFVDPQQVSWITVERTTIVSGAFRLPPARGSGAFFVAVDGKHPKGGTFKLHAALRGAPVRYTRLQTVRLNPSP